MRKILNFASFEAKKFSPSFRFKAKITKSKRSEKKRKKAKKSEKKRKKTKKQKKSEKKAKKRKNRLEFRFALFCFEAKITKSKRKI